jgi:hypothetical protein
VFLGHYALALGAKKVVPMVSLGTLFLAVQFADLLWPTLLALGIETVEIDPGNTLMTPLNFVSYPYSHSLVMLLVWSVVFALVYQLLSRSQARSPGPQSWSRAVRPGVIVGALVFSHYILDVLTHRPDMPVTVGGTMRLGFGLWNHPGAELAIESAMFIAGAAVYVSVTRPKNRAGEVGFWFLLVILVAMFFAAIYGPPPPNIETLSIGGHLQWLFVLGAYWVDRNRERRSRS